MRERAITTSVIWIALAASMKFLLDSVRYTELVAASPDAPTQMMAQTAFASTSWQIGVGVLIFMLIGCAMGATIAIWQSASQKTEQETKAQAEKAKRDNREERIKRLLASMDDEALDALEDGRQESDGEQVSLDALLRKRG